MEIESRTEGDVLVVRPMAPRLDVHVTKSFKEKLEALVNSDEQKVVIDLEEIEFIDSSGLGAIISLLKRVGGTGMLVVCNPNNTVLSLFKLTRIDKVLQIHSSVEEAVAAVNDSVAAN